MASDAEKLLVKFQTFIKCLSDDTNTLQENVSLLISTHLGEHSIEDVFQSVSGDSTLHQQFYNSLNHLVLHLRDEIIATIESNLSEEMTDDCFTKLRNAMELLFLVSKGTNLLTKGAVPDVDKDIEMAKEAVLEYYSNSTAFHGWSELSSELQEFLLGEKKGLTDNIEPLLIENRVVSSMNFPVVQWVLKKEQFVGMAEQIITSYMEGTMSYKTMHETLISARSVCLDGADCGSLMSKLISIWNSAIRNETRNLADKFNYTEILHKIFTMMNDHQRNEFAHMVYEKSEKEEYGISGLEGFVVDLSRVLSNGIHRLLKDPKSIEIGAELSSEVKDSLLWCLVISPIHTVQRLLEICVTNSSYISWITELFRKLPSLFDRTVYIHALKQEESERELLLITLLHKIIQEGRDEWSELEWDNLTLTILSCAKRNQRVDAYEILNPLAIIRFLIFELENGETPSKIVRFYLKMLLEKILESSEKGYLFSNTIQEENEKLSTHLVLICLVDLLSCSSENSILIQEILQCLGSILKEEDVVFDDYGCEAITNQCKFSPWWVKFAIFKWFSSSLQLPNMEVPSEIYNKIDEKFITDYREYYSDDTYVESMFKLGKFNEDLALELMDNCIGFTIPNPKSISEAIVKTFENWREDGIVNVLCGILKKHDPMRMSQSIDNLSPAYSVSLQNSQHILVLFNAWEISMEKVSTITSENCSNRNAHKNLQSAKQLTELLENVFYDTALSHIEQMVSEMTNLRQVTDALQCSKKDTDKNEESFALQLTIIYQKCAQLFHLKYQEVPPKLKNLMNFITREQKKNMHTFELSEEGESEEKRDTFVPIIKPSVLPSSTNQTSQHPENSSFSSQGRAQLPQEKIGSIPIIGSSLSEKLVIGSCELKDGVGLHQNLQDFRLTPSNCHVYKLHKDGPLSQNLGDDEDSIVGSQLWQLPCVEFDNIWENLIYDSNLKNEVMSYVTALVRLSEKHVNTKIINVNRLILLTGPPGTGKTSLCKGLAQHLSIHMNNRYPKSIMMEINSHTLLSRHVFESGHRVQKVFDRIYDLADDEEKMIFVLFDRVDSIATVREASPPEPSDAIRAVNALLTQIDRMRRRENVLILCTSNLENTLDKALIDRAGLIKKIGQPSDFARYSMLKSCVMELRRIGVVVVEEEGSDMIPEDITDTASSMNPITTELFKIAQEARGLSGRAITMLPNLVYSKSLYKTIGMEDCMELFREAVQERVDSGL